MSMPTTPATFTISAHSLGIYDRCPRAYMNYKVLGRKAVRSAAGMIAGTALHEGIAALLDGASVAEQEGFLTSALAESPIPADDYRTPAYLRDALAGFRAEFADVFKTWTIEEREQQGSVKLGYVEVTRGPVDGLYHREDVPVMWEYRRDMVGTSPDGLRYICDWKTSSRNEDAHYLVMKNSGQFMGYVWAWQQEHPDKPLAGVLPVRIILRKPSRTGVAFEFPRDPPILFQPERIEEWHRHTLRKVQALLARDPEEPDDWPLAAAELGCCRHTYGCCDYLPVCTLKPEDRMRYLATDAFEPADAGRTPRT